jgi:hypothetical protein
MEKVTSLEIVLERERVVNSEASFSAYCEATGILVEGDV